MFRIGVRFENLFPRDRMDLEALIEKLLLVQKREGADVLVPEAPLDMDGDNRRMGNRVILSSKGDMVAFITLLDGSATKPPPDPKVVSKKTGELHTYNIIDISLVGCSFTASDPTLFKPMSRLMMTILGEGLMLKVNAQVAHVVRIGPR